MSDEVNRFLEGFIDKGVLVVAVTNEMIDGKVPLTSENAKKIWLNVLERLSDVIKEAIEHQ
jgi:hypothetical protein